MAEAAAFYFGKDVAIDAAAAKKFLKPGIREPLRLLMEKLSALEAFDEPSLEAAFAEVMAHCDIKLGKIAQPVRVALTGRTASPGIFEILSIIGKDVVIHRLGAAAAFIADRAAKSA
jgi:glutamyl-tRNA synthetase